MLAVRLLQLKAVVPPRPPAARVVSAIWLKMLGTLRKRKLTTIRDFFRHLAGFLMRNGDGEPGWLTL